ncbi:MAG: TonB-dependent receptor plug domain-containing protein [Sphingobium sp.]
MINFTSRSASFDRFLVGTAIGTSMLLAGPAFAQEAGQAETQPQRDSQFLASNEIIVTASRTAQSGLDAPTPTQIVSAEVIDRQASETIMEVLNQNPAFKATRSPNANATNLASPGQATADLRALGGQRTLVLVNGARKVPFAPASNRSVPTVVDLNLMPTMMVERVDVVTGGASALYGSDAVSGVVNLIMKTKYEGIDARAQFGITDKGDDHRFRIGAVAGTSFADNRGHIVVSGEFSKSDGVDSVYDRAWGRKEQLIVPNTGGRLTDANGTPYNQIVASMVRQQLGAGAIIENKSANPAALRGMTFNPDGTMRPFQYGVGINGRNMIGGEGYSQIRDTDLVPQVERLTFYGSVYYDFADNVTGYIEGGWSQGKGKIDGANLRQQNLLIKNDNPFIPAQARVLLPAGQDLRISRIGYDLGVNYFTTKNTAKHGTLGFNGDFGGGRWRWDAHTTYGENLYQQRAFNQPIIANLGYAIDAVDEGQYLTGTANGNIVCRATIPGPDFDAAAAGCAPLNLFGENNFSQAAKDYVMGEPTNDVHYSQFTVAANLVGDIFELPAGPVTVAVGGEYRKEKEKLVSDALSEVNAYLGAGNAPSYSGDFDVKEAYIEASVPVFSMLDLNGAVRYADYSSSGGLTAWKLGGVLEPVDGLRFRVSRSRDIRAPQINELYSTGNFVNGPTTLNFSTPTGVVAKTNTQTFQNSTAGNPNVGAEIGETWTAGVAFNGSGGLRGFGFSADYYNIKIKDAISNPSAAQIAGLCNAGQQYYCNLFTYGPDPASPGEVIQTSIISGSQNIGEFSQEGFDVTLNYRTGLSFLGDGGYYSAQGSGTYVLHSIFDPGLPSTSPTENAGAHNPYNLGAIPTFQGNLSQTIGADRWNLTLQTLYISHGVQDNAYTDKAAEKAANPSLTYINNNQVPATWYFNLFGRFYVGADKEFEFFWAVNNLFDQDPRLTSYYVLTAPINGQFYDKIGRRFTVGARVKF